jgi:hypothetical protein
MPVVGAASGGEEPDDCPDWRKYLEDANSRAALSTKVGRGAIALSTSHGPINDSKTCDIIPRFVRTKCPRISSDV